MDDNALDREIDEAARQMTAGEAPQRLRARVLARIDQPRRRWRGAWIAVPVGIGAGIAMAIAVANHLAPPAPVATNVNRTAPIDPATAADRQPASDSGPQATAPPDRERAARRATSPRPRFSELDTLVPPALDVPSIALSPIDETASLGVPPIEPVAPIAIAAIDEPQGERP